MILEHLESISNSLLTLVLNILYPLCLLELIKTNGWGQKIFLGNKITATNSV
jgi:hypothetical protein